MVVEVNSHMSARGFLQTCLLVLLHVWLLERAGLCVCGSELRNINSSGARFVLPVARAALRCLYLSWIHGPPRAQQPPPRCSATTESAMTSDGRLTSIQARNHWWSLKNHHFSQSERQLRYIATTTTTARTARPFLVAGCLHRTATQSQFSAFERFSMCTKAGRRLSFYYWVAASVCATKKKN